MQTSTVNYSRQVDWPTATRPTIQRHTISQSAIAAKENESRIQLDCTLRATSWDYFDAKLSRRALGQEFNRHLFAEIKIIAQL